MIRAFRRSVKAGGQLHGPLHTRCTETFFPTPFLPFPTFHSLAPNRPPTDKYHARSGEMIQRCVYIEIAPTEMSVVVDGPRDSGGLDSRNAARFLRMHHQGTVVPALRNGNNQRVRTR